MIQRIPKKISGKEYSAHIGLRMYVVKPTFLPDQLPLKLDHDDWLAEVFWPTVRSDCRVVVEHLRD